MGIVPVFCIVPKCLFRSLYHEAILTSFLYSVTYCAHAGAIVAVFVSGLSVAQDRGRHKAECIALQHPSIIVSQTSYSTLPRAPCCRHSPKLLSRPPIVFAGNSFRKVKFWHCCVARFRRYHYLQKCLKV